MAGWSLRQGMSDEVDESFDEVEVGKEYDEFAQAFQKHFHGDTFLLLRDLREHAANHLMIAERSKEPAHLIEAWDLEVKTWELIENLFTRRSEESVDSLELKHWHSNVVREKKIYEAHPEAQENTLVLNWLRKTGPSPPEIELSGNRWLYTRNSLRSAFPLKGSVASDLVTELDPDAPIRQQKSLEGKDEMFERELHRVLFGYLRIGDFVGLLDMCRQTGNFWKAISIQGSLEYRNPVVDNTEDREPRGTFRKALWKESCKQLAGAPDINPFERGLYSVLGGELSPVLGLCNTWEDYMWAHYSAICENQLQSDDVLNPTSVLQGLLASESRQIREQASHPLRVVQGRVITNTLESLFDELALQIQSIRETGTGSISPYVLRVVTHILLCMRNLGLPNSAKADVVLIGYIDLLSATSRGDYIPMYASQLESNTATRIYAQFLTNLEDPQQRRAQIVLARKYGIDIPNTLRHVVKLTFDQTASHYTTFRELDNPALPDSMDRKLVQCLSYLTLDHPEDLKFERIEAGRYLFRRFLLAGRVSAADLLALSYPSEDFTSIDVEEDDEEKLLAAAEYVEFCNLMAALRAEADWTSVLASRPATSSRMESYRTWMADAQQAFERVSSGMTALLTDPGFLFPRDADLKAIKQLYVPHLILALHNTYFHGKFLSSKNLMQCMNLTRLVADVDLKLFSELKAGNRLDEYLLCVKNAAAFMASSKGEEGRFWRV